MSAFMVSKAHIDVLVSVFSSGAAQVSISANEWQSDAQWLFTLGLSLNPNPLDGLGDALIRANLKSVHCRYPETIQHPEDTPGPDDPYWMRPYTYQPPAHVPTIVEALKLLESYDYQSCEPDAWETSPVKKACDCLHVMLVHSLPGYEAAPWTI